MKEPRRSRRGFWFVVAAGSGLMLLTGAGAYWIKSNADSPQLSLEMAIDENSLLLPASHSFAANDAVGELLESLPPDLALDVCASLTGAAARTAKRPCDELREITAIAPAASPIRPESAIAAAAVPDAVVTAPTEPQVPADAAPTQAAAAPPQPSPIQTPVVHSVPEPEATVTQVAEVAGPPSAAFASGLAAAGAQIASAQTTEAPAIVTAKAAGDPDVTLSPETTAQAAPAVPAIGDDPMAYWLVLSNVPDGDSANADPGQDATTEGDATSSGAAAKARAEAKAKANAAAKAKAKAVAAARARAAVAAALNADNDKDAGNTANAGRGKDRDQGSSGSGSNVGGGGGGNNN
jgi:hypothetical protein